MSKKEKKAYLEAKRKEEQEQKQLKERILKAKQDEIEQLKLANK